MDSQNQPEGVMTIAVMSHPDYKCIVRFRQKINNKFSESNEWELIGPLDGYDLNERKEFKGFLLLPFRGNIQKWYIGDSVTESESTIDRRTSRQIYKDLIVQKGFEDFVEE